MPSKLISTKAMTSAPDREEGIADADPEHRRALRVDHRRTVRLGMAMGEGRGEIREFAGGGEHLLAVRLAAQGRDSQLARIFPRADFGGVHRHGRAAVEKGDIEI